MSGQLSGATLDLPTYQLVRRQRILDAAKGMLRVNDYESIQIRDVAAEANVALGTLYRYFTSKEHLYANVVYDWAVPFSVSDQRWGEDLNTTERVRHRIYGALEAFEKHPNIYKTMFALRATGDPEVSRLMHQLGAVLEQPIHEDFAMLDTEEASDITTLVWCVLMDLVNRLVVEDKTVAEAHRIVDRFVHMLGLRLTELGHS